MWTAGLLFAVTLIFAASQAAVRETNSLGVNAAASQLATHQESPTPLPGHPGNVFLAGETVRIPLPPTLASTATEWRLLDDRRRVLRSGALPTDIREGRELLQLGNLELGWYRLEFGTTNQPDQAIWSRRATG